MKERFALKYEKLLEILPDVAGCDQGNLILVGGTALALFHLKHRVSVDLDFVPVKGSDSKLKEALKGCLSKKGYNTGRTRYANQLVVHFENTTVKIEIFQPDTPIHQIEKHAFGACVLNVASLQDIYHMKVQTYAHRQEARDLFDLLFILKQQGQNFDILNELIAQYGPPKNAEELPDLLLKKEDHDLFIEVVKHASKADH